MKFAVETYMDQIKQKPDTEQEFGRGAFSTLWRWHLFDTEAEARQFIIDRASKGVVAAIKALVKAEARHRKCLMKFGVTAEERAVTARRKET